ncbi:MAG: SGNH/GDSL hydrolase family protein [Xanthobacteraceae bacterium]
MLTSLRAAACLVLVFTCFFPAAAPAGDAAPRTCRAQSDLTRLAYALPRTARRLANREPLTVVALGSSSTAGAGASSPDATYPSQLAAALQAHFPSNTITVLNRGVNGEEARDMLNRFDTSVAAEKPDLVLWQLGTNAVLRDKPASSVSATVREGVARIKALDADVILIDSQFSPLVLAKSENEHMLRLLAVAARESRVGLFPRFAVMRRWREMQHIPFEAFLAPDRLHMNDWSYACLARLLADTIVEAATGPAAIANAGPNIHVLQSAALPMP